jgi:hypothetical protein
MVLVECQVCEVVGIENLENEVKSVAKDLFSSAPKAESVTKTKESVTVTPAKKRGGSVKC